MLIAKIAVENIVAAGSFGQEVQCVDVASISNHKFISFIARDGKHTCTRQVLNTNIGRIRQLQKSARKCERSETITEALFKTLVS